jgi:small subunit ribosomal protein S3
MGQKVNPIGFRLPVRRDWRSCWYAEGSGYASRIKEDFVVRRFLGEKLHYASVRDVLIERAGTRVRVTISSGRPGVIVGRRGQDLEKLRTSLRKLLGTEVLLDVQEVKSPDLTAKLIA